MNSQTLPQAERPMPLDTSWLAFCGGHEYAVTVPTCELPTGILRLFRELEADGLTLNLERENEWN
jgi:hypothetical protein